jgi:GrpB-like predicted nucleotidyltransferase (UPF0157 family)
MGSTSIVGMPGKPWIDFTIVTKDLLSDIPEDILKKLKNLGYMYGGIAPHSMNKNAD